jgi:hypothetical protein
MQYILGGVMRTCTRSCRRARTWAALPDLALAIDQHCRRVVRQFTFIVALLPASPLIEEAERQGRRSGGTVVLAEMLGKSSSRVSRFAAEKSVTPSDRIAREIEQVLEKEHGWMDHVQLAV